MAQQQSKHPTAGEVIQESDKQKQAEKYNQYVKDKTPKHSWLLNTIRAFWVGGFICTIGQVLINLFQTNGVKQETAALYEVILLVLASVILTGLNIYPKIAKYAGAGSIVPITGFANSVASSAIEFKKEGQVFGIGCKIFTIAGPVILYGIFSSWVLGIFYWIYQMV